MSKGVECPRCNGQNIEYKKSWSMKSNISGVKLNIELWFCDDCRKSFRIMEKVY